MGFYTGLAEIKVASGSVFDQMQHDARLERGQSQRFRSAEYWLMVKLDPDSNPLAEPEVQAWIKGFVVFDRFDPECDNGIAYTLEVEIADGGLWRLRVPKRFLATDPKYVPETSPQGPINRPDFRLLDGPGESEYVSLDNSTWVDTDIVDDPSQSFVVFDAADRAALTPVFRRALAQAEEQAIADGVQLEPAVVDAAAMVDDLPRSRAKSARPSREAGGGFSML